MAVSKIFGDVTLLNANFMKNVEEVCGRVKKFPALVFLRILRVLASGK